MFIEEMYKEIEKDGKESEDDTPKSGAMEYLQYLRDKYEGDDN